MQHRPRPCHRLSLRPGQTLPLYLPAGTQLQLLQGRLELSEPPQWLADTVHRPRHHLQTGACHALAGAGWVRLAAGTEAVELLCHGAPPPMQAPGLLSALRHSLASILATVKAAVTAA
jgi:hypothetical protein